MKEDEDKAFWCVWLIGAMFVVISMFIFSDTLWGIGIGMLISQFLYLLIIRKYYEVK